MSENVLETLILRCPHLEDWVCLSKKRGWRSLDIFPPTKTQAEPHTHTHIPCLPSPTFWELDFQCEESLRLLKYVCWGDALDSDSRWSRFPDELWGKLPTSPSLASSLRIQCLPQPHPHLPQGIMKTCRPLGPCEDHFWTVLRCSLSEH